MKIKKLLLTVLLSTVFFSCSSNDNDESTDVSVEGTWKLTGYELENPYDINQDGSASTSVIDETSCYNNETIVFNQDNTGKIISRSYVDFSSEITIGGNSELSVALECIEEEETIDFSWNLEGNMLVLDASGEKTTMVVEGDDISYSIPKGYSFESVENNAIVTINENVTFTYTRQ
jgi:hypothetical protein